MNHVTPSKVTNRVVQKVVFLLALGFVALAYVATPLTTFAACPNNNKASQQVRNKKKNGVAEVNRVAVLMGGKTIASLRIGDKVRVKIATNGNFRVNGKSKILTGVYLGNSQVSVIMANSRGQRQSLVLPLFNPGTIG